MTRSTRRPLPALALAAAAALVFGCADGCTCGGETPPPTPETPADTDAAAPPPRVPASALPEPAAPAPPAPAPVEEGSAEGSSAWTAGESTAPTVTPPSPQLQLRRFDPSSTPSRLDPRAVRPQIRDLRLSPGPITP